MKIFFYTLAIIVITLTIQFAWIYSVNGPPRYWYNIDYKNVDIEDMKKEMPGYSGSVGVGYGWKWMHDGCLTEHRLILMPPGVKQDSGREIEYVLIETWIKLPYSEKHLFSTKTIFGKTP